MFSLLETMICFIYTQNLIGNITLSIVIIPVAALTETQNTAKGMKM